PQFTQHATSPVTVHRHGNVPRYFRHLLHKWIIFPSRNVGCPDRGAFFLAIPGTDIPTASTGTSADAIYCDTTWQIILPTAVPVRPASGKASFLTTVPLVVTSAAASLVPPRSSARNMVN